MGGLIIITKWCAGNLNSRVTVSDNLTHTKDTVVAYSDAVLDTVPASKTVCIWSDRPASQFKNRLIAAAIPVFKAKHQLTFKWNFFATSHGKGLVNGIGGSVKRDVWMQVKDEKQSSNIIKMTSSNLRHF